MRKQYLTAQEVAEVVGVSTGKAYSMIREMNAELKAEGYLTVSGKVPTAFFRKNFTVLRQKVKKEGRKENGYGY